MAAPLQEDDHRKTQRVWLRASETQRALLVAASRAEGTSVSGFVLRHAIRAAEDALADRLPADVPGMADRVDTAAREASSRGER